MQAHTLTEHSGTHRVGVPCVPGDCLSCFIPTNLCVSCVVAPRLPDAVNAANVLCEQRRKQAMGRKRVLIVDNDEDVLISLERALEENSYDTVTAWEVPEGLELIASRGEFDLLLVGDHPPELNCERLLKVLRRQDVRLPVVVMHSTARHPFSEAYLRHLGASGVACKWSEREVLAAVNRCFPIPAGMAKPKVLRAAAGM